MPLFFRQVAVKKAAGHHPPKKDEKLGDILQGSTLKPNQLVVTVGDLMWLSGFRATPAMPASLKALTPAQIQEIGEELGKLNGVPYTMVCGACCTCV